MACGAILRRKLFLKYTSSAAGFTGLVSKNSRNTSHYASSANTTTTAQQQTSSSSNPFVAIPRAFNTVIHMTRIKNDDKLIQSKGVEALLEAEVHKACRERGIHVAEEMQQQIGVCRPVSDEEILRFAKLFHDEHTLDHISRPVMENMCKLMGSTTFGTDKYMRFLLSEKLKSSPIRLQRRGFADVPLQGSRTKDLGALTGKLSELKNYPPPYPKFMFPSVYVPRGGVPVYETVSFEFPAQLGPMVYDLRMDVWPYPFYWMLHGIWPAYISGDWLVHYRLEELCSSEMHLMKEEVKQEIMKLDHQTKEILHEVWQSFGDHYEDLREQDMEFWAYQKVIHCWDLLVDCPKGHYFHMSAELGKHVRQILINWTMKTLSSPNRVFTSEYIRKQMRILFGVTVYVVVKADDDMIYDPKSTKIPFFYGLGFMVARDPTRQFLFKFYDHPSGLTKVPQGFLYYLA